MIIGNKNAGLTINHQIEILQKNAEDSIMTKLIKQPIGIFDSGVGGLTVFREIRKRFPFEDIVYFGDTANCPFGDKTKKDVIQISKQIVDFLIEKNCKIIIVACNTATASAIKYLRQNYQLPFIGMEPATKPASLQTKTGNIGILATNGTFDGDLFQNTKEKYTKKINVIVQVGEGLVEIVENDEIETKKAQELIKKYLQPMIDKNVDQIVLGCTHYSILKKEIQNIVGDKINLIDSSEAISNRLQDILPHAETTILGKDLFYVSADEVKFKKIAERVLNIQIDKLGKIKSGK